MIIRRAHRPKQYATIDMALMNDERLTADALGVLLYLLSRPDNWSVQIDQLKSRFNVGRDKMQSIMRLLRDCGYARLEQVKDPNTGRLLGQGYSIHDEAQAVDEKRASNQPPVERATVPAADVEAIAEQGATACDREPENPVLGDGSTENRLFRLPDSPTAGKPGSLLMTELVLNTERNLSPQPPETGGGEGLALWEKFETAWSWDVMESREPARRAFEQLDAVDQDRASRFARQYCEIAARRQRRKVNASKWLRDRGWENLAQQATAGTLPPSKVIIWAGTPQAAAWARHHAKPKLFMTEMKRPDGSRALGRLEDSEWPPSRAEAPAAAAGSPETESAA
jgi:hypothetical protein